MQNAHMRALPIFVLFNSLNRLICMSWNWTVQLVHLVPLKCFWFLDVFSMGFPGNWKSRNQRSRDPKQARISLLWQSDIHLGFLCLKRGWVVDVWTAILNVNLFLIKPMVLWLSFWLCNDLCLDMDVILSL